MNVSESLPELPSTVPDSQAVANVEQPLQELPNASVPQVMKALKKMSSQHMFRDTQPLSPETRQTVETLTSKSRHSPRYDQETCFTHGTLHKGDEGHIDLLSSYPRDEMIIAEEDEPGPVEVDFSPTQSGPNRLSQFPESQRFKTPATLGKKRNYHGDLVQSPVLPRNPLARNGQPNPGPVMGLSQVFAGTQAVSSPFGNGLPSELRSDRPSPAFALQPRPATATDSSPLTRPLLPRSSTEPQTKYISMQESQAIREARKRLERDGLDEELSDDSFDETPVDSRRLRKRQQRDREARRQFEAVERNMKLKSKATSSSPAQSSRGRPIGSSPLPSPIRPNNSLLYSGPTSPPEFSDDITNASEEETEQEDEDEVAVRNSSQILRRAVPEEDKENAPHGVIQIPQTTALHRVMSGHLSDVEASPSIRHSNATRSQSPSQKPDDGEGFFVANSQPTRMKQRQVVTGPRLASSGEQTDLIPQSQYPSNSIPEEGRRLSTLAEEDTQSTSQRRILNKPSVLVSKSDSRSSIAETAEETRPRPDQQDEDDEEDEEPPRRNLRSQVTPQSLSGSIPETSSARLRGGVCFSAEQRGLPTKSLSDFETAPTHPDKSSNEYDSAPAMLPSQALAFVSPARNKRKRMDEIDAEESQTRSSGPDFGDLKPMLIDQEYHDIMVSPARSGRYAKKPRLEASPLKPRRNASSSPMAASANGRPPSLTENDPARDEQEPKTTQGETPPASSDEILTSLPRTRRLNRPAISSNTSTIKHVATYGKPRTKPSAWDIQASPEDLNQIQSAPRTSSLRKPPSTLLPTETRASSTSRLSRVGKQRANKTKEQNPIPSIARSSRANALQLENHRTSSTPNALANIVSTPLCGTYEHGAPSGEIIAPNQVFACYNGKSRAYYPAICLGVSGADTLRYQIQWDGYEPDELDEHGVRSLDLRHGDSIKVNLSGFPKTPHVIRGFKDKADSENNTVTDVRGYKTLLVAQKPRKSLPVDARIDTDEAKEVPVSAIYLDSNMWNQFKDRLFTYVAPPALPTSTRPGISTPIDRPGTPSTPSSRNRRPAALTSLPPAVAMSTGSGCSANMAFAISYDSPIRKSDLTDVIVANEGLVLASGFHELFMPDQLALKPQYANLGFTALLADKHSRKEKYLQALALGLPCLSGKWVEACASNGGLVDWQSYLLPAGESDELEGAIRSRVLPIYDPATALVAGVVQSRPDILRNESVIFVLGRGKAEEKRRPYVFLTQALGAGRVQKVTDVRAAKELLDDAKKDEDSWVFVDDRDVEAATALFSKQSGRGAARTAVIKVVGNEFVKQSLVLGRMYARSW